MNTIWAFHYIIGVWLAFEFLFLGLGLAVLAWLAYRKPNPSSN